jgi:probable HAF family extracellular repeat protein
VRYEIQFWDLASPGAMELPMDMNNLGQVVGWMNLPDGERHGYLHDAATGAAVDLHTLYAGPGTAVPEGWRVNSGNGINDDGVIVGKLVEIGNPSGTPSIPYILDVQGANRIVLLPDFGPPGSTTAYLRINNNWDILTIYINANGSYGAYLYNYQLHLLGTDTPQSVPGPLKSIGNGNISLNNPTSTRAAQVSGQLADGTPFRWTSGPDGGLQTFSGLSSPIVRDLNDAGTLCGETTKQGKRYPMRLNTSAELLTGAPDHNGQSINYSGDVLLPSTSTNLIFHSQLGYFDLDKLVTGAADDVAAWLAGAPELFFLNDRDGTGFGQITGRLPLPDGTRLPFILQPIAP